MNRDIQINANEMAGLLTYLLTRGSSIDNAGKKSE
jgi:hypothetical protein